MRLQPWRFGKVPPGYWTDPENCRNYFDWLFNELHLKEMEGWYGISKAVVVRNNGGGLLEHYGGSTAKALSVSYPSHDWKVWKFGHVPNGFWEERTSLSSYIEWASAQLEVNYLHDWYRISVAQLGLIGPVTIVRKCGGLGKILQKVYPHHDWNLKKFSSAKHNPKASQRLLRLRVEKLLPRVPIYEDYLHPKLKFQSGRPMQLDLFLPDLSIALEYQGQHHYRNIFKSSVWNSFQRDEEKRSTCRNQGITLIQIPYW